MSTTSLLIAAAPPLSVEKFRRNYILAFTFIVFASFIVPQIYRIVDDTNYIKTFRVKDLFFIDLYNVLTCIVLMFIVEMFVHAYMMQIIHYTSRLIRYHEEIICEVRSDKTIDEAVCKGILVANEHLLKLEKAMDYHELIENGLSTIKSIPDYIDPNHLSCEDVAQYKKMWQEENK